MTKISYRQGDVALVPSILPAKAKAVQPDGGRVILAYGEVTGHAHAFNASRVCMFRDDGSNGVTYIRVSGDAPAPLQHEEHGTIMVPPGDYEVLRQREYSPSEIRSVAD